MMRNSKYIAMALAAVVLLAGCNSKSPTAPKPTAVPAFNISLTPETTTAKAGDSVLVTARVTSGSASAADGTAVNFDVSGGQFPPNGATTAVRTTTGGGTSINVTASTAGTATILGRVPGDSDSTTVTFTGVALPTPTPTYEPQIFALTPNAGPFEGGTQVTISGVGFWEPVQVLFDTGSSGKFQAQVVSTSYTKIVCISPSITPTAPTDMVPATVTVTNIGNGKVSNTADFRYGVTMFISSFTPMDGPADTPTTVTIFGQGFAAPVNVVATAGGQYQWDVLSVAGTEIVARSKPLPDSARQCTDVAATLSVTNVNSNTSFSTDNMVPPQAFTYRAIRPLISSVQIDGGGNYVQQYVPVAVPPSVLACSTPWSSHNVTVRGSGFQQGMTVSFGGLTPVPATFVDANTLTLSSLPDLSSISLNQIGCTTGAGACGNRFVQTQVSVSVNNPHNGCSDTLNGAIIINPCDTGCLITGLTSMSLGAVVGTPQVGSPFMIPLTFTPSPLTASATVNLTYVGFAASPGSVTIPPSSSPYPIIVTPTLAGSGNIIASVGGGSCTVTASSGLITVIAAAPTISNVTPNNGPAAGGTSVTITGTNFQAGAAVTFGGVGATVTNVTSTTITCTTPAGAAGAVNVVVTNPDAQSATLVSGFTYT
ncbi:MAG TPA: IPT/TIG domain-containing protein [Thermoanaerobaculaceae bacterium]|nr:IPT/TIG domain-containing protein [Thermoanaerobaculaceae bacterium]